MTNQPSIAAANNTVTANSPVPVPKLQKTIDLSDLGAATVVKKMTFSPDGRYLAIVVNPAHLQTDIVVWDLQRDKKQSHIHCPYDYGDLADHDLLWSRDGNIISFGAKRQWDPMTGNVLEDNPAIGRAARLNKDGSKMLTIVGAIGEPSYIHIYSTKDWSLQKLYLDGLGVETAAWTAEDKVLVEVSSTREALNKVIDGQTIKPYDVALRLLDPSGTTPTKTVWFPARLKEGSPSAFTYAFSIATRGKTNFVTNQIFFGSGKIIDGTTLHISNFHALDKEDLAPGAFGMAFSPDGQLLYLKGASFRYGGHEPIKNSVVDVASGKLLAQFDGAMDNQGEIAVSPDGRYLTLGDTRSIKIFSLQ